MSRLKGPQKGHFGNSLSADMCSIQNQSGQLQVRAVPGMHRGPFAKTNIDRHQISISYFGRHYSSETLYLQAFPNDDAAYVMTHEGEYFDGEPVEQRLTPPGQPGAEKSSADITSSGKSVMR